MSEDALIGNVDFGSRSAFRSFAVKEAAVEAHYKLGRAFTDIPESTREILNRRTPDFSRWRKIDLLDIAEGAKLPDLPGLYGFFNLQSFVAPKERILYIGKSEKSLKTRVTKQHTQFIKSLRYGASHACYITTSNPDKKARSITIRYTEIYLIQKWAPYLNREENPFNFEIEPIDFHS